MKGVLLTAAVALLIPGLLVAATPTVGVYFDGLLHTDVEAGKIFTGHLFMLMMDNNYWVTGVEYALYTPNDPVQDEIFVHSLEYPDNAGLAMGHPFTGHSITYWPPITFYPTGIELLVSIKFITFEPCDGILKDFPIIVGPHPDSGFARFAYYPDNELEEFDGLTSYLCLDEIATEEGSWGAIKSLYR